MVSSNTTKTRPAAADPALRRHLRSLGIETVEAYAAWCRRHGFSPALNKSWHDRRQEQAAAKKAEAEAAAAAEVMRHIEALGLQSVAEYRSWCVRHGFSEALHKGRQQRQQERLVLERERSQAALAGARRGSGAIRRRRRGSKGGSSTLGPARTSARRTSRCV